jgi:pectinesterase
MRTSRNLRIRRSLSNLRNLGELQNLRVLGILLNLRNLRAFFLAGFLPLFSLLSLARSAGTPEYDFLVAKDGTGNFKTIQEAVTACRDFAEKDYRIVVKKGVYEEKLVIPSWKRRITVIGEDRDSTIITWNDYSGKPDISGGKLNTFTSYTCLVAGTDIELENLTIVNTAGRVGQAVAVHVEGDRCIFRNCRLMGNQDTLFASGEQSRQYFDGCYIEGTTDFIFGPSTAVFNTCTIVSKKDSYITAASTSPHREHGFVFLDCRLLADTGATKVYLGRPWRVHAQTTFVRCEMGAHILPAGWYNWSKPEAEKTARYSEYKSTGPGANPGGRVAWSRQLTDEEAESLTAGRILRGFDEWNPVVR